MCGRGLRTEQLGLGDLIQVCTNILLLLYFHHQMMHGISSLLLLSLPANLPIVSVWGSRILHFPDFYVYGKCIVNGNVTI